MMVTDFNNLEIIIDHLPLRNTEYKALIPSQCNYADFSAQCSAHHFQANFELVRGVFLIAYGRVNADWFQTARGL
ncbi:hypothetical protein [Roseobacter sp. HKCCD7870]|uniref:hypothetical protein n=1 Tax=Roseobacter sp. HKCCD7870 TaxID=3120343 RepID=UPI0030EB2A37